MRIEKAMSLNQQLRSLKEELEKKFNDRRLEESYRTAVRCQVSYSNYLISRLSYALEKNVLEWLLMNGYEPPEFVKIMTADFDYGNEIGAAISVDAILAKETLPLNFRLLLALVRKNEQLSSQVDELAINLQLARKQTFFEHIKEKFFPHADRDDDDDD